MPLSPEQRIEDLKAAAFQFNQHLLETPGVVLNGELRWAITTCARDALGCPGCNALGHDVCLAKGRSFEAIADLSHTDFPLDEVSTLSKTTLRNLVHTVINHQSRLDSVWYSQTMRALDELHMIPETYQGESKRSLLCSLFCEIAILSTTSHSIHVAFLAMGVDVPPLPSQADMKTQTPAPSMIDMTTLLKKNVGIRQDAARGFAPYVLYNDLNPTMVSKLFPPDSLSNLKLSMNQFDPFVGWSFAPHDLVVAGNWTRANLYDLKMMFKYFGRLDPSKHCSDCFTQSDKDTVATAIAVTYNCVF